MWISRLAALIVIAALGLGGLWPGTAGARWPSADDTIRLHQRRIARNPYDAAAYYRLGDAYVRKAREAGDVTYFTLAEASLRKALEIAPRSSGASRHLAYVLYSRHAFEAAAEQAARAIDLDPTDSHAHGILGDAALELGRYEEARQAYRRMAALDQGLYALSRLSGLKTLEGDPEGAIEDLERAVQAGTASGRPAESIAWAQWQLANEHLALGRLERAEAQYLAALATYPGYYRALAGLAQVRAAQQRYAEAIDLYRKALGVIPLPEYAAALGDVYAKTGRAGEARKQYDLVEYIGRLNSLNQVLYNRELAYFYADHDIKPGEALELARKELTIRQDIYAHDLLAWALYRNDRLPEARDAMAAALRLGTKDARLFFHAGMIHARLGDVAQAIGYLRRALATNRHFHVLHADLAERTLRELEGRSPASPRTAQGHER